MACSALLIVVVCACGKKDPFDEAVIRKNLQRWSARDVLEKAAKSSYVPPAHGRITDEQVQNFIRCQQLSWRISKIAFEEFAQQPKRSSLEARIAAEKEGDATQLTVTTRAALSLGLDPQEVQWVGTQANRAYSLLNQTAKVDAELAKRKAAFDQETDRAAAAYDEALYNDTLRAKQALESEITEAEAANMTVVKKHMHEIDDLVRHF